MKRGQTDLSLMLAVNKPAGMTSHDVVNQCRRIFGERRIGHGGTLDPMAEGVLLVLVGPATRLNAYLESHDKRYVARIAFGQCTDTDDAEGEVIRSRDVPVEASEEAFARGVLNGFLGKQMQMPPIYSAIKKAGVKSYEAARRGNVVALEPRPIEVYEAELLSVSSFEGTVCWDVSFAVSKGTYIRALARDIGRTAGTEAHLAALQRTSIGTVSLRDCVSLDALEKVGSRAAIDPVRALGMRFAFVPSTLGSVLENGGRLRAQDVKLHEYCGGGATELCACTSGVVESRDAPRDGERIVMICDNAVKALYRFMEAEGGYGADCVFSKAVIRGVI